MTDTDAFPGDRQFTGVEPPQPHAAATADAAGTPAGEVSGRPGQDGPGETGLAAPPRCVVADDTLRAAAKAIRDRMNYEGRMTRSMLAALDELLDVPTPLQYRPGACAPGDALQWQIATMDAIFGRLHWTYRLYVQDGGTTGRGYVLIGNDITPDSVKVDPKSGELVIGDDAEILLSREGMGGVSSSMTKGTLLVATETHVMRRLLARFGVGGDMFAGDLGADATANAGGDDVELPRFDPDRTAIAGIGDRKADELQVKDLAAIVREGRLLPSEVADSIRVAVGAPPRTWENELEAQEFVAERLDDQRLVFPAAAVLPLKRLLEAAAARRAQTTTPAARAAAAAGTAGDEAQPGTVGAA